jgi:hypothetical protein
MKRFRCFLSQIILFGLLFLMEACSQTAPVTSRSTPSAVVRAATTTPPTVFPVATPPPLETMPSNCTPGPILHQIFPRIEPGIGNAPLWVFGFGGTQPVIRIDPREDTYMAPYGWYWKIIWEVGPHFLSMITLRGENARTGAPIWFHLLNGPIATSAVLDPQHPNHPVPAAGEGYAEWGSAIFIPVAGCYQIKATWPGGQWSFPFAAGR